MKRSKQSAAHFSITSQDIANGLQRLRTYIRVTSFCLPFFLLCPKRLNYRTTNHLRKQFLKKEGKQLIKLIESELPVTLPPPLIKVYHTKEFLDCLLELEQAGGIEHISSTRFAKTIDAVFNIGLPVKSIIKYRDNYKHRNCKRS